MKKRILATGPESSGTNALTRLLAAGGADATHRSQPEGDTWVDVRAMLDDFDHVVVAVRGLAAHRSSLVRRGIALSGPAAGAQRRRSLGRLGTVMGHPKVTVVTYESLREREERRVLLHSLGLDPAGADAEEWSDENGKYYR